MDRTTIHLAVEGVTKTFPSPSGSVQVLASVSFDIEHRGWTTLIGPSGCGKTTLVKILAGILRADSGRVITGERHISLHRLVAYMPQSDTLLPWRTALSNALLPAEIDGRPRRDALEEAHDLFARFGLAGFENLYPVELSGGMKQRLTLMRTFLAHRDILLLDEPLGALDALTRARLQEWLMGVWSEMGKTVLLVTHDVEEAILLSDRIVLLSARPACVRREFTVPMPRPRSRSSTEMAMMKEELLRLIYAEGGDV